MSVVHPSIDPAITALAPGFRALSITVESTDIQALPIAEKMLEDACRHAVEQDFPWTDAHLEEWSDAFRKFGAKPNRTPCSAAALRKRVFKSGSLPSIDPVVDIYNAISIRYAIPVGGEDMDQYTGMPRLTIADGSESFDTMKNGEPDTESPDAGEIIWRDDAGVTCRRWNWRQGVRTRITPETRNMWFILESLPAMPQESLLEAGQMMCDALQQIMPGAVINKTLITSEGEQAVD